MTETHVTLLQQKQKESMSWSNWAVQGHSKHGLSSLSITWLIFSLCVRKLSALAGMMALTTPEAHDPRGRFNYSLQYKVLKNLGKDSYLLSLDSTPFFRPVTASWKIKYCNCPSTGQLWEWRSRGEGDGWWLTYSAGLSEESSSWPKTYVWFFRPNQR